jgi:hypothetical protein
MRSIAGSPFSPLDKWVLSPAPPELPLYPLYSWGYLSFYRCGSVARVICRSEICTHAPAFLVFFTSISLNQPMTEDTFKMAYHASLSQISLLYSHVMTNIPKMSTLDNTSISIHDHEKPKWLVAIDYATIISLITVLSLSTCLLITTALYSWRGGAIRLDRHDGTEKKAITRKDRLSDTLLQNMDHTLFDDGEAVDMAGFWRKVSIFLLVEVRDLTHRYAGIKVSSRCASLAWPCSSVTAYRSRLVHQT